MTFRYIKVHSCGDNAIQGKKQEVYEGGMEEDQVCKECGKMDIKDE